MGTSQRLIQGPNMFLFYINNFSCFLEETFMFPVSLRDKFNCIILTLSTNYEKVVYIK